MSEGYLEGVHLKLNRKYYPIPFIAHREIHLYPPSSERLDEGYDFNLENRVLEDHTKWIEEKKVQEELRKKREEEELIRLEEERKRLEEEQRLYEEEQKRLALEEEKRLLEEAEERKRVEDEERRKQQEEQERLEKERITAEESQAETPQNEIPVSNNPDPNIVNGTSSPVKGNESGSDPNVLPKGQILTYANNWIPPQRPIHPRMNYSDFEPDTANPFDNAELKSLNTMAVLASVLDQNQGRFGNPQQVSPESKNHVTSNSTTAPQESPNIINNSRTIPNPTTSCSNQSQNHPFLYQPGHPPPQVAHSYPSHTPQNWYYPPQPHSQIQSIPQSHPPSVSNSNTNQVPPTSIQSPTSTVVQQPETSSQRSEEGTDRQSNSFQKLYFPLLSSLAGREKERLRERNFYNALREEQYVSSSLPPSNNPNNPFLNNHLPPPGQHLQGHPPPASTMNHTPQYWLNNVNGGPPPPQPQPGVPR